VLDYHDGVRDIRRRRLRIIGDPQTRYREDPVRMLRAVRFAAKLGFEIDSATRAPISRLASLIENVPAARLFDEMLSCSPAAMRWPASRSCGPRACTMGCCRCWT